MFERGRKNVLPQGLLIVTVPLIVWGCGASSDAPPAEVPDTATGELVEPEIEWPVGPPPSMDGPLTYTGQIQGIFQYWCTPCHEGKSPGACVGNSCLATYYGDTQTPAKSGNCQGMTKTECGLYRVDDVDPDDPDRQQLIGGDNKPLVMWKEHRDAIAAWIDAGMPE